MLNVEQGGKLHWPALTASRVNAITNPTTLMSAPPSLSPSLLSDPTPIIPAHVSLPEITTKGVVLSVVLAAV